MGLQRPVSQRRNSCPLPPPSALYGHLSPIPTSCPLPYHLFLPLPFLAKGRGIGTPAPPPALGPSLHSPPASCSLAPGPRVYAACPGSQRPPGCQIPWIFSHFSCDPNAAPNWSSSSFSGCPALGSLPSDLGGPTLFYLTNAAATAPRPALPPWPTPTGPAPASPGFPLHA